MIWIIQKPFTGCSLCFLITSAETYIRGIMNTSLSFTNLYLRNWSILFSVHRLRMPSILLRLGEMYIKVGDRSDMMIECYICPGITKISDFTKVSVDDLWLAVAQHLVWSNGFLIPWDPQWPTYWWFSVPITTQEKLFSLTIVFL
jgi:hypothetical protein